MKHIRCYNHYGNVRKRERNVRTNLEFSSEMSLMYMSECFFFFFVKRIFEVRLQSQLSSRVLNFARTLPFFEALWKYCPPAKRTAVDFTDDKVKANRRYGASNKKLAAPPSAYSGNVWVLPRATVYIPALMQASSAKTDRPNRCWRYAPLFPEKTSLT